MSAIFDSVTLSEGALSDRAMADFPQFQFSKREVMRAGKVIAGDLAWNEQSAEEIRHAFLVANNWRDAHAFPMRSVRQQLIWYMGHRNLDGITAARLKRMHAIRKKLKRTDLNKHLNQLQDLGGCRSILLSIADVRALADVLLNHSRHTFEYEDDYIENPKDDGYRSYHIIFSYCGKGTAEIYNGRRIEIQIRSRLQHSWATAVESIGLFLGEDLKGHHGNADWLRLFYLMSGEFALAESCNEPPNIPPRNERVKEIIDLDKKLKATNTLENLGNAVRFTEMSVLSNERPTFYLIKYDNVTNQVQVEPSFRPASAIKSYDDAESPDNKSGKETKNVVLVEADKLENLKLAYPNYFGDVNLFKRQLKHITEGKAAREYNIKPQATMPVRADAQIPDISWFRRSKFRRPKGA